MQPLPSSVIGASARSLLTERLRTETRDLHEGLEHGLDWRRRMGHLDGYRSLLERWWGFHRVFEPLAEAVDPDLMRPRRKLHLIERDLSHFGLAATAIEALPRFSPGSALRARSALLGALYVTEGSTLGGQVIARHVRDTLGATVAGGGCAYYAGYGRHETAPMWASFRAILDQCRDTDRQDAVIDGARWTFDALRIWLTAESPTMPAVGIR